MSSSPRLYLLYQQDGRKVYGSVLSTSTVGSLNIIMATERGIKYADTVSCITWPWHLVVSFQLVLQDYAFENGVPDKSYYWLNCGSNKAHLFCYCLHSSSRVPPTRTLLGSNSSRGLTLLYSSCSLGSCCTTSSCRSSCSSNSRALLCCSRHSKWAMLGFSNRCYPCHNSCSNNQCHSSRLSTCIRSVFSFEAARCTALAA